MGSAIALFGSSRRYGNTGRLLDDTAARLDIEVVDLGHMRMSPYDYEHRNRDDDFEPLMKRVLEFDHIIVGSPVYWYSVSPPVKIFLDRIRLPGCPGASGRRPSTTRQDWPHCLHLHIRQPATILSWGAYGYV
jgi:multimeric flavodoxin WrbA